MTDAARPPVVIVYVPAAIYEGEFDADATVELRAVTTGAHDGGALDTDSEGNVRFHVGAYAEHLASLLTLAGCWSAGDVPPIVTFVQEPDA